MAVLIWVIKHYKLDKQIKTGKRVKLKAEYSCGTHL